MLPNLRLLSVVLLLPLASCGSTDGGTAESSTSTVAEFCAGDAHQSGDIATIVGCAFENQLNNVRRYGTAVTPVALYDASGQKLGSASRSCDAWWQATDGDGVTLLVNAKTGEVRAHGMVHPSMPTTTLPRHVPTPLAVY